MNSINIIGRIGKEIELKYLQSGSAVASFSIAVDQSYKKDGQKVEKTSWFDVSAFGKTAETVNQYFHKGSMIGITGELEQQTWKAQDGSNRSKVIIKLQNLTFIDKKADGQSNNTQTNQQSYQAPQQGLQQQYQQQQQAPQQQSYQANQQPQTQYKNKQGQQMTQQQYQQQTQQPPAIDVDEDEIPFRVNYEKFYR